MLWSSTVAIAEAVESSLLPLLTDGETIPSASKNMFIHAWRRHLALHLAPCTAHSQSQHQLPIVDYAVLVLAS